MQLPFGFQYNQSNLQDYQDCPRRFYLRHLQQLAWPAIEAEPMLENEMSVRNGEAFHRLLHQYFTGIPREILEKANLHEPLRSWWNDFMQRVALLPAIAQPGATLRSEYSLSAPLGSRRIIAKYDLLATTESGQVYIFEWKTYQNRPKRNWLKQRLQTVIYPFLITKAGIQSPEFHPLQPEEITLVYWFANFPDAPEVFAYNSRQFESDQQKVTALIHQINQAATIGHETAFPMTLDDRRCLFCNYRSYCERGGAAGNARMSDEQAEDSLFTLQDSLEFISEVEF